MRSVFGLACMFLLPAGLCFGSLEYVGNRHFSGSGLGAVATVLTAQEQQGKTDPGDDTKGCVSFNGTSDVQGDNLTGEQCTGTGKDLKKPQTKTVRFDDAKLNFTSLDSAKDIAVFYNSSQAGGAGSTITLTDLNLLVYDGAGVLLFQSGSLKDSPLTLTVPDSGTGTSGFVFKLDAVQTEMADNQIGEFKGEYRFGLAVGIEGDTGGLETFSIFNDGGGSPVPEPATFLLMGGALVGLAMYRRRQQSVR
jgi:hypothetical protein